LAKFKIFPPFLVNSYLWHFLVIINAAKSSNLSVTLTMDFGQVINREIEANLALQNMPNMSA
jgi:hypothetical protein